MPKKFIIYTKPENGKEYSALSIKAKSKKKALKRFRQSAQLRKIRKVRKIYKITHFTAKTFSGNVQLAVQKVGRFSN